MIWIFAAQDAVRDNEWSYVAGAYGLSAAVLVAYVGWVMARGRKLGKRLPPGGRRWM